MNFDLGPYADYIWPSYALSAGSLLIATIWTLAAWRAVRRRLAMLEAKR